MRSIILLFKDCLHNGTIIAVDQNLQIIGIMTDVKLHTVTAVSSRQH